MYLTYVNNAVCKTRLSIRYFQVTLQYTVFPGSSGPFYVVTYYIKWVTTPWTHSTVTRNGIAQGLTTTMEQDPTGQKYGRMDEEGGLGADKE